MLSKLLKVLDSILVKKDYILFYGYPDFAGNAYGMFDHLYKNRDKLNKKYKFVWLVYKKENVRIVKDYIKDRYGNNDVRIAIKNSFKSIIYYLKSKYMFSTHGVYNSIKLNGRHVDINLWHGMPLKKIGILDNKKLDEIARSDYMIATSDIFVRIMSEAFHMKQTDIWLTGQPRNDLMFEPMDALSKISVDKGKHNGIFLWTPTFRSSKFGDIRSEGSTTDSGLPVLAKKDLVNLDEFLSQTGNLVIIKLHAMDKTDINSIGTYKNIKVIDNSILLRKHVDLYNMLNEFDALITDYSSIYFDFLLLDKPIGFLFNDSSEYEKDRGFLFKPLDEWMPGQKITCLDDLKSFMLNVNRNIDMYRNQRKIINDRVNKYKDDLSGERILEIVLSMEDGGYKR